MRLSKLWAPLLCCGALAFACKSHSAAPATSSAGATSSAQAPHIGSSQPSLNSASTQATRAKEPEAAAEPKTPQIPAAELRLSGGAGSVTSALGMVTSVEAHATRAGVQILEAGGNAVDAAVAVAYALAVTHPSAGNIGGGGFILVHEPGQKTQAIDFREVAPKALTPEDFNQMLTQNGRTPAASGVPGTVAGLNRAHERFGRLPRAQVMQPAIDLARRGHAIGHRMALTLEWSHRALREDPEARRIFAPKRKAHTSGTRLVQKDLADTLERIAKQGDAGFYAGKTAEALVKAMGRTGRISLDDLKSYRAKDREVLSVDYRGVQVEVMPPPSAGGVAVVQMLNMLSQLKAYEAPQGSARAAHWFIEAAKRAHADRRFDVVDPDTSADDPLEKRRAWLDPQRWLAPHPIHLEKATPAAALHDLYAPAAEELENTTHFSVADSQGMLVSCTVTLSAGFGAKYVAPGTGVVMNNTVGAFSRFGQSTLMGGRRMTSSMSPAIAFHQGKAILALGSPGGDTIPNTVVQVLRNVVDYGMPLAQAVEAGRLHHGFLPDEVRYERRKPPAPGVLDALRSYGHKISTKTIPIGDANNILISEGKFYGVSDSREGGLAAYPKRLPSPE